MRNVMRIPDCLYPTRFCNFFSCIFSKKVTSLALPAIAFVGLGVLMVSAKRYLWSVTPDKTSEKKNKGRYTLTEEDKSVIQRFLSSTQPNQTSKLPEPFKIVEKSLEQRRQLLKEKREESLEKYPPYLDEMLQQGKIHLFDHMIEMKGLNARNERSRQINQISFSELAHVVLEGKEMILQCMESVRINSEKPVVFLLGPTGSGKSTTFSFLAGDEMELRSHSFAFASKGKFKDIIGHSLSDSCTFLPLVYETDKAILVDFPGFEDTHEALINLGIEGALHTLVQIYKPKILVLKSVTGTHDAYALTHDLCGNLIRLLKNPQGCILGLTMYLEQSNYIKLRSIEDEQKKEYKEAPFPDTEGKRRNREKLKETEENFKQFLGIQNLVRLDDLENPELRSFMLNELTTQGERIEPKATPQLSAKNSALIKKRLEEDLLPLALSEEGVPLPEFSDDEAFISAVQKSSLTQVIFKVSNPEVGKFLCLPEMDPKIVQDFENKLIKKCLDCFVMMATNSLNSGHIHKVLEALALRVSSDRLEQTKIKMKRLQSYILDIEGIEKTPEAWAQLYVRSTPRYRAERDGPLGTFKVPFWAKVGLNIQINGSMGGLFDLMRAVVNQRDVSTHKAKEAIDEYCQWLDDVHEGIRRLKKLKAKCSL